MLNSKTPETGDGTTQHPVVVYKIHYRLEMGMLANFENEYWMKHHRDISSPFTRFSH
jgi:hypothetical protein